MNYVFMLHASEIFLIFFASCFLLKYKALIKEMASHLLRLTECYEKTLRRVQAEMIKGREEPSLEQLVIPADVTDFLFFVAHVAGPHCLVSV